MKTIDYLRRCGLSNDLFEYSNIISRPQRAVITYCSNIICSKGCSHKMGKRVYVGDALKTCPKCKSGSFLSYANIITKEK